MPDEVQETATVSFVKDGYAYLKTDAVSACGGCASKSSCASGRLTTTSDSDYTLRVPNTLNVKQGDKVILGIAANKLLVGTGLMYLLPLAFLFLFAGIGKYLGDELTSILAGLMGLTLGFLIVKKIVSRKEVACHFEPEMKVK